MTPSFLDEGHLDAQQTPCESMAFADWEALASQVRASTRFRESDVLANPGAFAAGNIDQAEFFPRAVLVDAIRSTGCKAPLDEDFIELHALLQVPIHLKFENMPLQERVLLEVASIRFHRLLEMRPELAHPNIRFRWGPRPENYRDGALYAAAMGGMLLTPDRMDAIADHRCVRAAMAKLQGSNGVFESSGVSKLLSAGVGFTRGAAALIRAGLPTPVGPEDLAAAAGLAGRAATLQTTLYEDALLLLGEIKRSVAKDTGARLTWYNKPASELLEQTDFAWASARSLHPVTIALYQMFVAAAKWGFDRHPDVADFPGRPAREIVEAINACLVPSHRMPLESLSALQLLKLTALCSKASENGTVSNYMYSVRASTALEHTRNSCDTMLAWALRYDGAGRLKLADFDALHERLVGALGTQRVTMLRAQLLHDFMKSRIDDLTSVPAPVTSSAPPARRARTL